MGNGFTITVGDSGTWLGLSHGFFPEQRKYSLPTAEHLSLGETLDAGEALHDIGMAVQGSLEVLSEVEFSDGYPGADYRRWREISGLCRSSGSALELVVASLCETSGFLRSGHNDPTAPMVSAFVLEAAMQYLVSAGHNLTNVAFRLCIEDSKCQTILAGANSPTRKALSAALQDGTAPAGWLYHSQAAKILEVLKDVGGPAVAALRLTAELYEAAPWQEISEARNTYFHRMRDGFRETGPKSSTAAQELHQACTVAAKCIGRAVPSFYHRLNECFPRGKETGFPLIGNMRRVDPVSHSESPLLPDTPFSS